MPYLQLCTSARMTGPQKHSLCEEIGKLMPLIPGKTRENTMMNIVDGCYMEKADPDKPSVNVEVRVLGAVADERQEEFISKTTDLCAGMLGADKERIYINIGVYDTWGSNGKLIKAP